MMPHTKPKDSSRACFSIPFGLHYTEKDRGEQLKEISDLRFQIADFRLRKTKELNEEAEARKSSHGRNRGFDLLHFIPHPWILKMGERLVADLTLKPEGIRMFYKYRNLLAFLRASGALWRQPEDRIRFR
jgi:hypothetical protein